MLTFPKVSFVLKLHLLCWCANMESISQNSNLFRGCLFPSVHRLSEKKRATVQPANAENIKTNGWQYKNECQEIYCSLLAHLHKNREHFSFVFLQVINLFSTVFNYKINILQTSRHSKKEHIDKVKRTKHYAF